ncbi:MAG: hypothetical protein Q4G58_03655 [bacterium]|nr:hypothetical protein [bacterium]
MLVKPNTDEITLIHSMDTSIYTLNYNGFYSDYDKLYHVMELENEYLHNHKEECLHLCTLFYNTNVTSEVIERYIQQLLTYKDNIDKIAIVGIPVNERPVFRVKLVKEDRKPFHYQFFSSVKSAVEWLNR